MCCYHRQHNQVPGRFALSAGENIGAGDASEFSNRELWARAAGVSGASVAIESLPRGYDTLLEEGGGPSTAVAPGRGVGATGRCVNRPLQRGEGGGGIEGARDCEFIQDGFFLTDLFLSFLLYFFLWMGFCMSHGRAAVSDQQPVVVLHPILQGVLPA